jgi:transposase-like protein
MDLSEPRFHDANAARDWLEAERWPHGPVCPHCGNVEPAKITHLKGKAHRRGVYQCNACREQFTVQVGTVLERSKIPLNKWVMAMHLMGASKKGMSAHQLHRMLDVSYPSAWFMAHRIREAMREDVGTSGPLGGEGKIVEADETYHGKIEGPITHSRKRYGWKPTKGGRVGPAGKRAIVALVERKGSVRSFHVAHADKETVTKIIRENVARESRLHTDESRIYGGVASEVAEHETIRHASGEYVRGDVHTNTVENVFSVFKRGMHGVYHHCREKHLHRYLAEFDFRYNRRASLGINDAQRVSDIVRGADGKRLTYRRPHKAQLQA